MIVGILSRLKWFQAEPMLETGTYALSGGPTMRFLLKVNIPNDAGNAAARTGTLGKTIKAILDEQKPEAVYFTDDRGQRCGYLFIEMADATQIPAFAEPWFLALNAQIELHPVMTPEDLAKAAPGIERAAARYGK
jgi:hypothetical protein